MFRTAVSYTGRELYAVWIKPEYEGYLSMTKRISRIPGEMINARHHANEVSSTNAAFILIKKLLTEDVYKDLPDKLNLVIVPMEMWMVRQSIMNCRKSIQPGNSMWQDLIRLEKSSTMNISSRIRSTARRWD